MSSDASTGWRARAKGVAARLKAEYEAGKQGDESPPEPIWATPQQQMSGLMKVIRGLAPSTGEVGVESASHDPSGAGAGAGADADADAEHDVERDLEQDVEQDVEHDVEHDADADDVAAAIRGVDWAAVRASTADRTVDASKAMRAMAEHVDWTKVQPVAAQVSSALIAALASGQLGVGGRLASTVARAMTNQNGLGQRVAEQLGTAPADQPPDFRPVIEAASREV